MQYKLFLFMASSTVAIALTGTSPAQQVTYSIVDLGTLAGSAATTAPGTGGVAINNNNQITGFSIFSDVERNVHAFLWQNGSIGDLAPLAGSVHSQGFAINNSGTVVGTSYVLGDLLPKAVRWTSGVPQSVGNFVARGVNDMGTIVGEQPIPPGYAEQVPVRWSSGVLTQLPTLGGSSAGAYAIDSAGRIVGMSLLPADTNYHAVVWINGVIRDLGTLGGARSHAFDINDNNQIVGFAQTASGVPHACIFQIDSSGIVINRTDLGGYGGTFSYGFSINASGDVVGSSDSRATLWDENGIHDLNLMIPQDGSWELMKADAINDAGWIIGYAKHYGLPRTFLLGPAVLGDFDGNGHVDVFDLFAMLSNWGDCDQPCPPSCVGDISNSTGDGTDCTVNVFDLFALLNSWG